MPPMPLAPQLFSHLGLVSKDRSEKTALLGTTPGPFPKSYTKEFALFHTWVYSWPNGTSRICDAKC